MPKPDDYGSDDFLRELAKALKPVFDDAKYDGVYLVVKGCKFDAELRKSGRILFLDSGFTIQEDGSFDVQRAVGLLVAEMPAKLKQIEDRKAGEEFGVKAHKLRAELKFPDGCSLYYSKDGLELRFVSKDEALIRHLVGDMRQRIEVG